jgi:hypothetical protein
VITERISTERLIRTLVIVVLAYLVIGGLITIVSLVLYFS